MLNCTYSHNPLALPLGELSLQATERVLGQRLPSPSSLRSDTYPKGRGKWDMGRGNSWLISASLRGKDPRKSKRFSWSVQGSLRGNRNPLRLVFFLPLFLLEKQKKKWDRSRKFVGDYQPCSNAIPSLIRSIEVSLPSSAQSSVAPPGVDALPDTATRSGHRTTEFLTSSFAASATSAS